MIPKVGQRWRYKDNCGHNVIVEITKTDRGTVVQHVSGGLQEGMEYGLTTFAYADYKFADFDHSDASWQYLQGQDKP